jgi:hypothetical protein
MESSLRDLQLLSHLRYPMDTCQLTSSQGEADGVSEREYDVAGVGGGEFALQLVSHQRVAPLYRWSRSHTHTLACEQDSMLILFPEHRKLEKSSDF